MRPNPPPPSPPIVLLVNLLVLISFIVSAQISLRWTLAVSIVLLLGLVCFLWNAGARKKPQSER